MERELFVNKEKYMYPQMSQMDTDGGPQADGGQVLIKGEGLVIKDSTSLSSEG